MAAIMTVRKSLVAEVLEEGDVVAIGDFYEGKVVEVGEVYYKIASGTPEEIETWKAERAAAKAWLETK
jgi:hypothetical protein